MQYTRLSQACQLKSDELEVRNAIVEVLRQALAQIQEFQDKQDKIRAFLKVAYLRCCC